MEVSDNSPGIFCPWLFFHRATVAVRTPSATFRDLEKKVER
jgi:hypothetical protein